MGLGRRTDWLWVFVAVGLGGCAGQRPRTYAQQGMDSVSNTCRTQPALCVGPESVVPVPRAAQVATLMAGAKLALDAEAKRAVESVLKQCADKARTEVLLRYNDGKDPTVAQCNELVRNARGETVSRAIWLGEQLHAVALACAGEGLEAVIPGRFSIEPTYRPAQRTGTFTPLSHEEVELLKQPRFLYELKGAVSPDIVIHTGDPIRVSAVYDFKFFCSNAATKGAPGWRPLSKNPSPTEPTQKNTYMDAFNLAPGQVLRVIPRWGVLE
ncbi:hypothetical protein COCOR_06934 [Corallococcus coralloides DSM 2259]|uniref:Lipoprotein n=1 Tax=Corallococcus coralloides (strain ATCC 25202 / DSM 2259 / NBRC 100086 / M2) TaxID=1144275 RepID=H8N2D7_CORCM|nr:hypothetical protein [Corallococcus coralloides]AFE07225.1 hypothetical protein COCOR_06934 [Corallococcus coralloides DSM 2259]